MNAYDYYGEAKTLAEEQGVDLFNPQHHQGFRLNYNS